MKRFAVALIAAFIVMLGGTVAHAGGSDSPTPYTLTSLGIELPEGDVFPAHGHVNVDYYAPDEQWKQSANIHFDPNNNHPGGDWIGESFIPWDAFGIPEGSEVVWVQISMYNEHFGEGGQKPVPTGPKPDPNEETRFFTEVGDPEPELRCEDFERDWTVTTWKVWEKRESTVVWNSDILDWEEVWGDWYETDREVIDTETRTERVQDEECGMPPTGAPLLGAAVVALLLGTGGFLAIRKAKNL